MNKTNTDFQCAAPCDPGISGIGFYSFSYLPVTRGRANFRDSKIMAINENIENLLIRRRYKHNRKPPGQAVEHKDFLKLFYGVCRKRDGFICDCGENVVYGARVFIRYWFDKFGRAFIIFCSKDCHDTFEAEYYKHYEKWFD